MLNLKLGDVVTIGGQGFVVATISGLPPNVWTLVLVPAGKQPADLGKTWSRAGNESLTLFSQPAPIPSVSLETPTVAPSK